MTSSSTKIRCACGTTYERGAADEPSFLDCPKCDFNHVQLPMIFPVRAARNPHAAAPDAALVR